VPRPRWRKALADFWASRAGAVLAIADGELVSKCTGQAGIHGVDSAYRRGAVAQLAVKAIGPAQEAGHD